MRSKLDHSLDLFGNRHLDSTEMVVIIEADVGEGAGIVEGVEIGDGGIEPESRRWWQGAILNGGVVASDVLADAGELVFINVSVIRNKGELAGASADTLGDEVAEDGVLGNIKGETQRNIGRARSNEEIEPAVNEIPLGTPDATGEGGGREPFVLPERHNHAAVARGLAQSFEEVL